MLKATSRILFLSIILTGFFFTGCKKDVTDETDITEWTWKLKSVTTENDKFKTPGEDQHRDNAYMLIFTNDSVFQMDLSVNYAGAMYQIKSKGEITIFGYGSLTELCCESDFDNKLLTVFREVTTYEVLGNILTFKGTTGEVKFKKE